MTAEVIPALLLLITTATAEAIAAVAYLDVTTNCCRCSADFFFLSRTRKRSSDAWARRASRTAALKAVTRSKPTQAATQTAMSASDPSPPVSPLDALHNPSAVQSPNAALALNP